jgi:uncharacterized membrane-anchored protein
MPTRADNSGEDDDGGVIPGQFIIAGGNAAPVLEMGKGTFDDVAGFVSVFQCRHIGMEGDTPDAWKEASAEDWNYRRLGEICMALGAVVLVLALALPELQLIAPFAFMMFILGCALPSRIAGRLFGNAVIVFLGTISFSIYLVHIFVLGCLTVAIDSVHIDTGDWPLRLGASAVYLPLVLVTAYLTWRFVERPTHEFARRHGRDFTSRTLAWFGSLGSLPDRSIPAPATLAQWAMRIVAMSLGVTAGDFLSTTLGVGFGPSTFILLAVFFVTLTVHVAAGRSHPLLSWTLILCSTMAGTTMSDFLYGAAGLRGSILLLIAALGVGRSAVGLASVERAIAPRVQIFYWTTFLILSALGTTMGDFLVRDVGLGYAGAGLLLCGALACVVLVYCFMNLSLTRLFWVAFVLTRSLGMTAADTLTRSQAEGGLQLGTAGASAIMAAILLLLIRYSGRDPDELNGWPSMWSAKEAMQ